MQHTLPFFRISKKSVSIAGGKGASLGEMSRAGIAVPSGYVVLADTFDQFLKEADILDDIKAELNKVNYQDTNSVDRASNVIRDIIHDTAVPKVVAAEILEPF